MVLHAIEAIVKHLQGLYRENKSDLLREAVEQTEATLAWAEGQVKAEKSRKNRVTPGGAGSSVEYGPAATVAPVAANAPSDAGGARQQPGNRAGKPVAASDDRADAQAGEDARAAAQARGGNADVSTNAPKAGFAIRLKGLSAKLASLKKEADFIEGIRGSTVHEATLKNLKAWYDKLGDARRSALVGAELGDPASLAGLAEVNELNDALRGERVTDAVLNKLLDVVMATANEEYQQAVEEEIQRRYVAEMQDDLAKPASPAFDKDILVAIDELGGLRTAELEKVHRGNVKMWMQSKDGRKPGRFTKTGKPLDVLARGLKQYGFLESDSSDLTEVGLIKLLDRRFSTGEKMPGWSSFGDAERSMGEGLHAAAAGPIQPLASPTGHTDWSAFTAWDAWKSAGQIKPLGIRVLQGNHFGPHKGFGMAHIEEEHQKDFENAHVSDKARYIHRVLLEFDEVYETGGRLTLVARRPAAVAIVELREEADGFYSVITAFPKANPAWKPRGVRILGGRKAAFTQSASVPAPTAQGSARLKPPLETLAGKDPWNTYAR